MVARTTNPRCAGYRNYGARGIQVCERWLVFENFAEDMGASFREDLEIERENVDGHYEPGNSRWVTHRDQQRNKRTNHRITIDGITLTAQEWGERLGLKPNTIITRLRRGWPVERALLEIANG